MPQTAGTERGRRSSRVLVSLALAVSGQKSDGSHISGAAETILVNRHGARIRSTVPLEPKMEVRVAMLAPYKWRVGQVVWADSGEREYGLSCIVRKTSGEFISLRKIGSWAFPPLRL